ncbi:MAG: hypothetical protein Q9175_000693 [Cornicularia normoerica]
MDVSDSTSESFASTPPFPDDVPTAPLVRISLEKLLNNDHDETTQFFTAYKDMGFFHLDLRGTLQGQCIVNDADKLFDVGKQLYDLFLEEKQRYDFSAHKSYSGYKGYGTSVFDKNGTLESQRITTYPKTTSAPSSLPCHLPTSSQPIDICQTPPQPIDDRRTASGARTDFGSITILSNRLGGLQVLPPGDGAEWCYVRPLPDHAIINLGDAAVEFTSGLLRSNIHRVVSPPGAQASCTRYSLVYSARPEDKVRLERLEGSDVIAALAEGEVEEVVSAKEWISGRAFGKRVGHFKEEDWERWQGTESVSRRNRM